MDGTAITRPCAAARYRDVHQTARVLGAHGPALTAVLYEELADTLRRAMRPAELADAATKALTIIAELDAAIIGDSAFTVQMGAIHRHAAASLARALAENDPFWSQAALNAIEPIADAWGSVRSSA